MFARKRKPERTDRTREARRAQMVQVLTLRRDLTGVTAADVACWTGLPEPECAAALQREIARRAV